MYVTFYDGTLETGEGGKNQLPSLFSMQGAVYEPFSQPQWRSVCAGIVWREGAACQDPGLGMSMQAEPGCPVAPEGRR